MNYSMEEEGGGSYLPKIVTPGSFSFNVKGHAFAKVQEKLSKNRVTKA